MPDITPSAANAQSSTTSINAQFLNAVTRGDKPYVSSLLARGADVNATDAVGRSAVACAVAGERCAPARVVPGVLCVCMCEAMLNAWPLQLADRRSFIYDYEPVGHPPATC